MKQYNFTVDLNGKTVPAPKHWQFCIGSGHAALAQRTDYVEQLKTVHDELGIERVRFHGIFDDDMNVCPRPSDHLPIRHRKGVKIYNFYQIGKIYDNVLKTGVKPFVELGFMPDALASGKKTVFYYKGNVTMPKDIEEWQNFISEFIRFLIDRYGGDEIRSWYFEVWNEPNLPCFFKGSMNDYFALYTATVKAIKSVDKNITVGGPATTCSRHLPEFLDYCKKNGVPVDFVSTHQYPTDALGHSLNHKRLGQIKKLKSVKKTDSMRSLLQPVFDNVNDFTNKLKGYMTEEAKRAKSEAGALPLFYTEWSISSNCVAAIHDTPAAAAFFVKTVLDNQGIVDGSSYWTFSDIFEELFFFTDPFCGGFGLLTVDAIKKPVFWTFKMLAQLPETRYLLPVTHDDAELAAFRGEDGRFYIVAYAQNFESNCKAYSLHIELKNSPDFSFASLERIGYDSGNPVVIWEQMGKPAVLSKSDVEKIKTQSVPEIQVLNIAAINSKKSIDISISSNEVILIKLG